MPYDWRAPPGSEATHWRVSDERVRSGPHQCGGYVDEHTLPGVFAFPFAHTQPGTLQFTTEHRFQAGSLILLSGTDFHGSCLLHPSKTLIRSLNPLSPHSGRTGLLGQAP